MVWRALILSIVGTLLIGFGSLIAIGAPGDGMTGMIAFPSWILGGVAGFAAVNIVRHSPEARRIWPVVTILSAGALFSIAWSFYASITYKR
jgi:hypothetical protein